MWRQTLRWWRLRFKGVFRDNLKWGSVTDLIFFMYLCSVMEEKSRRVRVNVTFAATFIRANNDCKTWFIGIQFINPCFRISFTKS